MGTTVLEEGQAGEQGDALGKLSYAGRKMGTSKSAAAIRGGRSSIGMSDVLKIT